MSDMIEMLGQLADDWEYSGEFTESTLFRADMGLESLDVVVLAASIQERYGKVLPFNHLFTAIGQRSMQDISIGEWVDFIDRHLIDADVTETVVEWAA